MKILNFFIMILIIIGCAQNKSDIELIRPTNENYFFIQKIYSLDGRLITKVYDISDKQVEKVSKAVEGVKAILLKSETNYEITKIPQGVAFSPNQFLFTLYINELGKIDKVVSINSPSKEADNYLVSQMKDWQMEIYELENNPIKYAINWEFSLFMPKGENKLSLLNSSLKVSEIIENEILNLEDYFVAADEMPSPIGGIKAIQEKIKYPETAKKEGIEGRVYIKAFINENGDVVNAEIIKGTEESLDKAAIEAVSATKFEPGRQKGKAVKVQVTVPILFKLSDDKF